MDSSSSSPKREFLKNWIRGLQICTNMKKYVTILDRKNAIRLSSDVAIASTRKAATQWSRALLHDVVSRNPTNKTIVEQILGHKQEDRRPTRLIACSRRILRRSHTARYKASRVVPKSSSSIAGKLVKNRTRVLRKLVPGGGEMDGVSLIQETLDYIGSLQLQVDVMRRFATAAASLNPSR